MKNILVGLAICLAFSLSALTASAAGQAGQSISEEAKILELNRQWYELGITRDVAALDQLLAADFVMTNSYGRVVTRDQLLERYRSPEHSFKLKSFKTDDVKVRRCGHSHRICIGRHRGFRSQIWERGTHHQAVRPGEWTLEAGRTSGDPDYSVTLSALPKKKQGRKPLPSSALESQDATSLTYTLSGRSPADTWREPWSYPAGPGGRNARRWATPGSVRDRKSVV